MQRIYTGAGRVIGCRLSVVGCQLSVVDPELVVIFDSATISRILESLSIRLRRIAEIRDYQLSVVDCRLSISEG